MTERLIAALAAIETECDAWAPKKEPACYVMARIRQLAATAQYPAPGAPEISAILIMATRHVTPETCDAACADAIPEALTFGGETGFFCYVHSVDSLEGIPPDLVACIEFGRKHGARYILVDRDGPECEGLAIFDDWDER